MMARGDGIRFEPGPLASRLKRTTIREIRMRTGMVFQDFNLFPHLTVIENVIEAPITVKRMPRQEATDLGMHFLKKVGVAYKRDEHPIRLSGAETAGGHCQSPGHAAQDHALR